ncbi:MAG: hypothetical protein AAF557_21435 [Pseudomonadota bacterium]
MRALSLATLIGIAFAGPANAVDDYDLCIAMIVEDPARAEREAGEWARYGGGGAAARHCYALALIEIGASVRAADELIATASEEADLPNQARADLLVQAGELLVTTDYTATAAVVAGQALQLVPGDPGALGLRAAVRLANAKYRGALQDLNEALAKHKEDPRLLLRRASAQRLTGNAIAARDDASFATELAPELPDAWLERGRIEAKLGDKSGARASFLKAIELERDGKIARAAQLALQRMEAGVED